MDWSRYQIAPGAKVRLADFDPSDTGKHKSHHEALPKIEEHVARMAKAQYLLYADGAQALLIVLQALDAGGKDGTIRHLFSGMNPQGVTVACFKQPTPLEQSHDFLWRVHAQAPPRGHVTIFNRSHYEDVLVVRVHGLVPRDVWSKRYDEINAFEHLLGRDGDVRILKFYLHISPQEQLARFKQRLDDPARNWKISESDYTERGFWPQYVKAYEETLEATSTKHAPWFVIPSNHKWYRDLVISRIVVDTLEEMKLKLPPTRVDLKEIAAKYHAAEEREKNGGD
ncbi:MULTISPECIES: polyphosphate kinase 2 family protein [Methylosinus]|uniref:Polyphosphate kinase 2 n=1 Tax=Methylosinus trichosporium (strain ATCC 35070 / NCIMB 11131 / UNIQEM 75 / OB3b) TaxID=595536 RepID=A0A2D2CW97_METT3|nr:MULTISPECIES: polyphosphate kinase 2 family protein [Methylosinus]ATQ67017.1 polyphosphate kinase 2 [Methylosinus trichosporium OB3b]OBS54509.1 polyphosphate kinase 2 [Methylosinus sp. 3S-1]